MAKKEVMSLKSYSKKALLTIILLFLMVLILTGGVIASIYLVLNQLLQILICSFLILGILIVLFYIIFIGKRLYDLFYKQGIEITTHNIQALSNFDKSFDYYEEDEYKELKDLNTTFKDIAKNVGGRTIISQGLAHQNVPLKYDDEEKRFVNESSLIKNMHSLIIASESYRNALIDISYNLGKETIEDKSVSRIYNTIRENLSYEHVLISFKENKQGFVVYVPAFDSINQLKEELEYIIKDISLVKKGGTTKRAVVAHVSVAIYPYSSIDNVVKDLAKARKEKKVLNIYIPERTFEFNNKLLFSSMNINNTTKLIEDVSSIDPDPKLYASNLARIKKCINNTSNYYGFDAAGYLGYDKDNERFVNEYSFTSKDEVIFKESVNISKKFIQVLNSVKDSDSSYYFSNRKHINNKLALYVDQYRIRSGLFYVLTRDDKPFGVLYFLNRHKDLSFDAYMKESLITSCHVLGSILEKMDARRNVNVADKRLNELLKISGMTLYSVNKANYEIARYSQALVRLFPSFDASMPCYKALYGLNKPCKNCPLKQKRHMISEINSRKYEVYPVFASKDDPTAHLLIQPQKGDDVSERFDDETLLSSFASFRTDLGNQLLSNVSGKILLFKIKNVKEVISSVKNGGYVALIKEFSDRVLTRYVDFADIYQFNSSTLALILHDKSDEDIVSICQEICDIVQSEKVDDTHLSFMYLVKNYSPNDTNDALQKSLLDALDKYKDENEDEIVFVDTEYKRSASLDGYLLEQLLSSFGEKTYEMEFTPLLSNNTRLVYGVEITPNVIDRSVNKHLDIAKAVEVAYKKGFGDIYADGMLSYLDDLISRYTYTFFMSTDISCLSLKVDHAFISQNKFLDHLKDIYSKHQLPKGFIAFEVSEDDVYEHEKEYKDIVRKAAQIGVSFIVYNYEGNKFTVASLGELGFKEIKFSKKILSSINDQDSYNQTTYMWLEAIKQQMKVNFTGVESRKSSEAIVFEGYDCGVQGDYYFKPMDEVKAFEVIRTRNMKDKDNLDN